MRYQPTSSILLIDGDSRACDSLRYILENDGHLVARAACGPRALQYLRGHEDTNLVLLDLEPPETGGYDFLKARATIEEVRNIPIVVMTNHAVDPSYAQNHAVLRKPVYEEELRKIVQMALAMRGWRN